MKIGKIMSSLVAALLLLASCNKFEGEQTVPAFISIDAIKVVDDPANSWLVDQNEGFYSQLIDAVQIQVLNADVDSEMVVGTFQLPCVVPVLQNGPMRRVRITPVIKQNGISGTRIYYPYFKEVVLDTVVLNPFDTVRLDTVTTHYFSRNIISVPFKEYFEPYQATTMLSSAVQILNKAIGGDTVLTDHGCGVVRVKADQKTVNFWAKDSVSVPIANSYLYLEMDYWSDFSFSVGFNNPMIAGGQNEINSAMMIYPNKGWQKIYINLGKLWKWYNSYRYIKLYFTIVNSEGKEGNLFLDNMKLVVRQ